MVFVAQRQRAHPSGTAVGAPEDALLRAIGHPVAGRRDVQRVRVVRVDADTRDVERIVEPSIAPGGAAIAAAEDPFSPVRTVAGADVEHLRVGVGHRDVADRVDRHIVEDRLPGDAGVGGLPQSAGRSRGVERERLSCRIRRADVHDAAALLGAANGAEVDAVKDRAWNAQRCARILLTELRYRIGAPRQEWHGGDNQRSDSQRGYEAALSECTGHQRLLLRRKTRLDGHRERVYTIFKTQRKGS